MTVIALLARRSSLASFENAYPVAIKLLENTGVDQFVVRTDNPIQPFRVSRCRPHHPESLSPWSPDQVSVVSLRSTHWL
ncbi:hypothetical protein QCD71_20745 [Sphingomonas sp. PsM26]|nr:hypothetical protein [Sphingomonas sp. PsM26]